MPSASPGHTAAATAAGSQLQSQGTPAGTKCRYLGRPEHTQVREIQKSQTKPLVVLKGSLEIVAGKPGTIELPGPLYIKPGLIGLVGPWSVPHIYSCPSSSDSCCPGWVTQCASVQFIRENARQSSQCSCSLLMLEGLGAWMGLGTVGPCPSGQCTLLSSSPNHDSHSAGNEWADGFLRLG